MYAKLYQQDFDYKVLNSIFVLPKVTTLFAMLVSKIQKFIELQNQRFQFCCESMEDFISNKMSRVKFLSDTNHRFFMVGIDR